MGELQGYANELGAELIYVNSEESENIKDGLYLRDVNVIYIRSDLSTLTLGNKILHELGHAYYNHAHYDGSTCGSKQEAQANYYMVSRRFKEWLSHWDFDPEIEDLDIERFMKTYEFNRNLYSLCEKVIHEYCGYYETA